MLRHTPRSFQDGQRCHHQSLLFWTTYFPDTVNLSTTFKGTLSIVIVRGTWLVPGCGWNITFVFFSLIVSPNRRAALAKESVILFISLIECAMSAQSSANSRSRTSNYVVLALAFRHYRSNVRWCGIECKHLDRYRGKHLEA